jgi:excinuclease ABC subunit C
MFLDEHGKILYVGKAKDLKSRVSSYFTSPHELEPKTQQLVIHIQKIKITIVESELESLLLEAFYIKKFTPKYNIRLVDNKTYPMIKITAKDTYPAVFMTRKITDSKSVYFGPYPSSSSVKLVLKTIRRAFPYMSTANHAKRTCLYNHIGLCPCIPVNDSPEIKREYKKNIKQIIRILEGESPKIIKELERERDKMSKEEKYEEAALLQKRIAAMNFITSPFHRPGEYDINPNLREDIRLNELNDLKSVLNRAGYRIETLDKIECYDISHIQGTNTTASLVVFVKGEKESSLYRKFKIRLEKTPDDFASMQEVLRRRLKHPEWELPDLVIVDGGKGQVSSALELFNELGITIPLIGLAKREETIVVPLTHSQISTTLSSNSNFHGNDKENFQEIIIPHSSKALHLMMRIRDEAHRFAITYHRKLRSKAFIEK